MNWYLEAGLDSPVVMSSRIIIRRNIDNIPFKIQDISDLLEIEKKLQDNMLKISPDFKYIKLKDLDDVTLKTLSEKNIISPKFLNNNKNIGSIVLSDDETVAIEINSTDHLKIKVVSAGLDLSRLLNVAQTIEEKLSEIFKFSFSNRYGYLTQDLKNLGTAMTASVKVFLPALTMTNNISQLQDALSKLNINMKAYPNDIYQLSNTITLGKTPEDIITNLNDVVLKVVEEEKEARKSLEKNPIGLEDKILRAYGILANAKSISNNEVDNLLNKVRLGVKLGIIPNVTDLMVNKIYLYSKPNMLRKLIGENLDLKQLELKRAQVIKKILNNEI